MDEPGDLAETRRLFDERLHVLARGCVYRRDAHLVPGVRHDLGGRVGVLPAQVGQQDVLTRADPPRDGLADLTRPDDYDYVSHNESLAQVFSFTSPNIFTIFGSRWSKKRLAPVSSVAMASMSSALSSKSKILKFSTILSLRTDFGMTTTPL